MSILLAHTATRRNVILDLGAHITFRVDGDRFTGVGDVTSDVAACDCRHFPMTTLHLTVTGRSELCHNTQQVLLTLGIDLFSTKWQAIRGLAIRVKIRREVRDKNENKLASPEETCIRYSQQFKQV